MSGNHLDALSPEELREDLTGNAIGSTLCPECGRSIVIINDLGGNGSEAFHYFKKHTTIQGGDTPALKATSGCTRDNNDTKQYHT